MAESFKNSYKVSDKEMVSLSVYRSEGVMRLF